MESKKARSLSPDNKEKQEKDGEETEEKSPETAETTPKTAPVKVGKKVKKKKEVKKETEKAIKASPNEAASGIEANLKVEQPPAEETVVKIEKKHKKEKGKTKEKGTKKKKKAVAVAPPMEVPEVLTKAAETSGDIPSESREEQSHSPEVEPTSVKTIKKRKHGAEAQESKAKEGEKPTKKRKKKKHQQEVVFQPWADLEEREAEERLKIPSEEDKLAAGKDQDEHTGEERQMIPTYDENDVTTGETATGESSSAKRVDEVFSDWSDDDSPLGGDSCFDDNETEKAEENPTVDEGESCKAEADIPSRTPAFDDVYDPISDDELDAMLEEEEAEEEEAEQSGPAKGEAGPIPMSVEDVDWSVLVTSQSSVTKTGMM